MTLDFSQKEIRMIINIYNFRIGRERNVNYSQLSSMLEVCQQDRSFIKIKKWLKEIGVLNEYSKVGSSYLIEIDNKKLGSEIPEIPFIRFYEEEFRGKQGTTRFIYK